MCGSNLLSTCMCAIIFIRLVLYTIRREVFSVKILSRGLLYIGYWTGYLPTGYSTLAKHHYFLFCFLGGLYFTNVTIFSLLRYELTMFFGILVKAKTICVTPFRNACYSCTYAPVASKNFVPSVALFYPKSGTNS
jgi:hypothetical protein